jgi:murein DD-endopeptidase MepM/ murein hydrolase activator NlpD
MPRTLRLPLFALIALLVVGLLTPTSAGAASRSSTARKRAALSAKRAELARKINALKASDAQLESAVAALNVQLRSEQAQADRARRAANDADAKLKATEQQMAGLRSAVVTQAVAAYVRPQGDPIAELASSRDLNEASRRTTMLAQITNRGIDVIDQLRAARQDYEAQRAAAAKARDNFKARAAVVQRARDDKARLEAALDARIKQFQGEVDALARDEGALNAALRGRASFGGGDAGRTISNAGLIWPVSGPVTSGFGYRWGRLHAGIDIGARTGTPIHAAKAGTVIYSGQMSGYGNIIVIDHGGGFTTRYGHQSRLAARDGAVVSRGQVIGYVGCTGHCTGPHLHFETRVDGNPQNPRRYLS